MKTIRELAEVVAPDRVAARGAIRRMAITLTTKALWQLAGFVIDGVTEVVKAEPFTGIGIAARPPTNGKPEAVVANVQGDANNPIVIAVRDEKTRAAIAGAIKAGETMLFNALAFLHIKDDSTIEARTPSGTAVPLATKSDAEAAATWDANHIHLDGSGMPTSGPLSTVLPNLPNPAFPTTSPMPFLEPPSMTPTMNPFRPGLGVDGATIAGTTVLKGE